MEVLHTPSPAQRRTKQFLLESDKAQSTHSRFQLSLRGTVGPFVGIQHKRTFSNWRDRQAGGFSRGDFKGHPNPCKASEERRCGPQILAAKSLAGECSGLCLDFRDRVYSKDATRCVQATSSSRTSSMMCPMTPGTRRFSAAATWTSSSSG